MLNAIGHVILTGVDKEAIKKHIRSMHKRMQAEGICVTKVSYNTRTVESHKGQLVASDKKDINLLVFTPNHIDCMNEPDLYTRIIEFVKHDMLRKFQSCELYLVETPRIVRRLCTLQATGLRTAIVAANMIASYFPSSVEVFYNSGSINTYTIYMATSPRENVSPLYGLLKQAVDRLRSVDIEPTIVSKRNPHKDDNDKE